MNGLTLYAIWTVLGWQIQNATRTGILGYSKTTNPTDTELITDAVSYCGKEYAETCACWSVSTLGTGEKRLEFSGRGQGNDGPA